MKFAKYIESESIPEWRRAYLNYKGLKKKLKYVERFRRTKERRAAVQLDNTFQDIDDENASMDNWPKREYPTNAYYWKNDLTERRPSIMSRISSRFAGRSTSRPASFRSSFTALSVLDEVLYHASPSEREFFDSLDYELNKISRFYDEKEKECKLKLEALKVQIEFIAEYGRHLLDLGASQQEQSSPELIKPHRFYDWINQRKNNKSYAITELPSTLDYVGDQRISYNVARNRLKKAITEFYRSLEFLKSYKTLNETGFQKILKKFDKVAGWKASNLYMQTIKKRHWVTTDELDYMIHETETLYINEYAEGHRRRGMSKLRAPDKAEAHNSTTLRIGVFLGIAIPLFIQSILLVSDPKTVHSLPNLLFNTQIYACFLLPILFTLGFAVNLIVWHRSRINYKFIFELDPRNNLDYHQFAELPAIMLLISSLVIYMDFSQIFHPVITSELCPLILFVILISMLFCPFDILYCSARKWLGIALGRILLSYCFPVEFRDFFIADELNSLAYSLWTSAYFFCAYSFKWTDLDDSCNIAVMWIAPFLASLPPWWRLLQCFRRYRDSSESVHLYNGAKYLSSIMAAIVTGLRRMRPSLFMDTFWIVTCVINSCYTTTWDIKMDWGLLNVNSRYFLLRNEIVFYPWTYYVAVPINVLLRFSWVLNLCHLNIHTQVLAIIIALMEGYRRIQWNFFRLENEHLNNCGQYRAIKDIPLPFALPDMDTKSAQLNDEEEATSILSHHRLPSTTLENVIPPMMIPISRHTSQNNGRQSVGGPDSMYGSFYGRRDFENKQDPDPDMVVGSFSASHRLSRRPSTMENVLTKIKSMRNSIQSDDSDNEEEDENSEEN